MKRFHWHLFFVSLVILLCKSNEIEEKILESSMGDVEEANSASYYGYYYGYYGYYYGYGYGYGDGEESSDVSEYWDYFVIFMSD